MNENKWVIIINPVSGSKKGPKVWSKLKPLLDAANIEYESVTTQGKMQAWEIAVKLIERGNKNFLIIGGDGTANEVVNGIFSAAKNTNEIVIGMISVGTGNDWVRTTGKHSSLPAVVNSLQKRETFLHDTGVLNYKKDGKDAQRYFVNIAGLGFDGMVAKKLSENGGFLKGTKIQYWAALVSSLLFYHHTDLNITVNGKSGKYKTLSVAAGICKYNGGGMMQLPNAKYNDGLLDMTVIMNMSKLKMVTSVPKLTNGSFLTMKEIKTFTAKEFSIESEVQVYVEADGEYLGETPAKISIIPSAISVLKWIN